MKKFVKALLVFFSITFLAGAVWAKPLKVTWIAGNATLQTEQRIRDGFNAYTKKNDIKDWKMTYLDSAGSADKMANNILDAVSRGSEFIIITASDLRASENALASAHKAGIPVFTVDCGFIPGNVMDLSTNNWQMSSEVTLALVNRMHGKGNLFVLTADSLKPVRERTDTLFAILKEYPDIKVIGKHDLNMANFYQDATNAVQDAATRFGKKIDAVWTPWDEPAQAAVTALKAAGLNVPVTGMDGHPPAITAICQKGGTFVATGRQQFEEWGATLANSLSRVGDKGESLASIKTSDIVYFPAKLFTQADCKS